VSRLKASDEINTAFEQIQAGLQILRTLKTNTGSLPACAVERLSQVVVTVNELSSVDEWR
jgi:conjugal transfer/entry exclusion protein